MSGLRRAQQRNEVNPAIQTNLAGGPYHHRRLQHVAGDLIHRRIRCPPSPISGDPSPLPRRPAPRIRGCEPLQVISTPRRLPAAAVRAQTPAEPGYLPESELYKIEAILRPWRVPHVSSCLVEMGIRGVTVPDVRGFGAQGGSTERHEGSEFSEDTFISKVKMEIVLWKEQVEAVIDKIIEKARTGEIGDGKIFVIPVSDVVRIRTDDVGSKPRG